jgi:plastocyanin
MKRRLSVLVTLLASALLLVPIALAQGQDPTVQPVPQDQTVQPAAQDQSVQPVPIQDVASVSIGDNFFDVADIVVEPGTTVYWSNDGQVPHTVTADDGSFDSGQLNPGDSYIVTFLGSGRLSYYCQLHPEMVGSVTVGGGSGGGEAAPDGEVAPSGEPAPSSQPAPNEPVSYDADTNENVLNTTV